MATSVKTVKKTSTKKKPTSKQRASAVVVTKSPRKESSTSLVTKKAVAKNDLVEREYEESIYEASAQDLKLRKNHDSVGTTIVSMDDKKVINNPTKCNTSQYGSMPMSCYGETNHKKNYDVAYVVKKFDPRLFEKAYKIAIDKSNKLSKRAAEEYNTELERIRLVKSKNVAIAKINSLRLLNKAVLIEKSYNEQQYEIERHRSVVKDIRDIKPILLEQNDNELNETLANLSYEREVEMSANVADRNRALSKIEERREIIMLKRQWQSDRIKTLAKGECFDTRFNKHDVTRIKRKHEVHNNDEAIFQEETTDIAKLLSSMDRSKLSLEEKIVVEKFLKLKRNDNNFEMKLEAIRKHHNDNDYQKHRINEYHNKLQSNIKDRKYMVVNSRDYNKILNAKKDKFQISEDAVKFSNYYRSLHDIYDEFDGEDAYKKKAVSQREIEDIYTKKEINHSVNKWKRIERAIQNNDDYNIIRLDDNSYKIEYLNDPEESYYGRRGRSSDQKGPKYNPFAETWKNFVSFWADRNKYYAPAKIARMREDFIRLVNSQIAQDNIDVFQDNGLDLYGMLDVFADIDPERFERNFDNDNFIKNEVGVAFVIYYRLVDEEIEKKRRVQLSEKLDVKYGDEVKRQDQQLLEDTIKADRKFKNKNTSIDKWYENAVEHAKNQHFIKREEIIENHDRSLAKEEQRHLSNIAFYKNHLKRVETSQLKYEISEIDDILKRIERFNSRNPENKIVLSDIPTKINPHASESQNIKIDLVESNNKVMATTRMNDKVLLAAKTLNERQPDDVQKIIILDKFRSIKDPLKRAAMLRELADVNLQKDLRKIDQVEANQLNKAKTELKNKMDEVEQIRSDAELINLQKVVLECQSKKMDELHKNDMRLHDDRWRQEKANLKARERQLKRELKKAEQMEKETKIPTKKITTKKPKNKVELSEEKTLVVKKESTKKPQVKAKKSSVIYTKKKELEEPKTTKKPAAKKAKPAAQKATPKTTKKPKSRLSNILSFSRGYDEIDLDEIIGKKTK